MPTDRRTEHTLRKLVALGNHLCMWAGREPVSNGEEVELNSLVTAWDETLAQLRKERREIEHISL